MIIVSDRALHIPPSEKRLGFTGDNMVENRVFEIRNKDLFSMHFRIDIEGLGKAYSAVPEKIMSADGQVLFLCLSVTSAMLTQTGMLTFQLRGFDTADGRVWHSEKNFFYVSDALDAEGEITQEQQSQFAVIESRISELYEKTKECAESAEKDFDEIKQFTQTEAAKVRLEFDLLTSHVDGLKDHISELEESIGDTDAVIDGIIALQNAYIRGEYV